ncbi:hypothetical protein [Jiulongibacter sp. NS-SX5]|uniref:hypothetical protein n=1 Tax=Jiulongibacter sp. NS-SX5 TaxID=3463854 RepID=UPI004059E8BD
MTDQLIFTESIKNDIIKASKWAKFLAVLGFIGSGFMALAGLVMIGLAGVFDSFKETPGFGELGGFFAFFPLLYLAVAVAYFFPSLYLYRFAEKSAGSAEFMQQEEMEKAFGYHFKLYRFVGVFTIAMFALYIIMIIVMSSLSSSISNEFINAV